jgi:uncharacterized repeat protein (TIGR03803 family)
MHRPTLKLSLVVLVVVTLGVCASAQNEKILYTFGLTTDLGAQAYAGLTPDGKGNLYGTTQGGGAMGGGTVFELIPGSNGSWTEQVLHNFTYQSDGGGIYGGVAFDAKGNLYGTTAFGGLGNGVVFQLVPGSNGVWTENTVYSFGGSSDGGTPFAGVVVDGAGNLYGTTNGGGAYGFGVIFQLIPGSNGIWTEKVLHSFADENDGISGFESSLTLDVAGNLYGVASGGPHDYGLVFELVHSANGSWTEKTLHAFTGGLDGSGPNGGVIFDTAGNLYGVSQYAVYELLPGSGAWTLKVLYTFKGGADGAIPDAPLTFDQNGNLYGTTSTGGKHRGTVFKLTPSASGAWTERVLHSFSPGGADGIFPNVEGLVVDAFGNIFGTTVNGGASSEGVIYEITQ